MKTRTLLLASAIGAASLMACTAVTAEPFSAPPGIHAMVFTVASSDQDYEPIRARAQSGQTANCAGCHKTDSDSTMKMTFRSLGGDRSGSKPINNGIRHAVKYKELVNLVALNVNRRRMETPV